MKKLRLLNTKICLIVLALLMPIVVTGVLGAYIESLASAEASTTYYYNKYMEPVSLTNNNFNSSNITSISTNPSGWSKQVDDNSSTAGIINVGSRFENYKKNSFYLSVNPGTSLPNSETGDNQILMINSKTANVSTRTTREGFASNSVTLEANSYYTFQVSVKSDTNYETKETYTQRGNVSSDVSITRANFNSTSFGDYLQMTYNSRTRYAHKELTREGNFDSEVTAENVFYFDGDYVGFMREINAVNTPIYVSTQNITSLTLRSGLSVITNPETEDSETISEDITVTEYEEYEDYILIRAENGTTYYAEPSQVRFTFSANSDYFTSNIEYRPSESGSSGSYYLRSGEAWYNLTEEYTDLDQFGTASIYVKGLTNSDGEEVDLSFEKVLTKNWTTFFFFIETGNSEQTVNLELWLGGDHYGMDSTGVVFFDDVQVQKYSENHFFSTYLDYKDSMFYTQNEESQSAVKFISFNEDNSITMPSENNFDFENTLDVTALNGWTKSGNGNARIISLNSEEGFERVTGHDFTGSNLHVDAKINDDGELTIKENNQALVLWADNDYVEATSKDVEIKMHGYYKISVYYKISSLDEGNVYLNIRENSRVIEENNLTSSDENETYGYALASGSATATENAENNFENNYNILEIYVKGSDFYNSYVNIALGLGSESESATGCVVFDDIKVENVTYEEFSNADNQVTLHETESSATITNGYFNSTENTTNSYPLAPSGWTIESDGGLNFGGVINTKASEYDFYKQEYLNNLEKGEENPYLWASFANPLSSSNSSEYSNNILMLANYNSSAQTLTSSTFTMEANSFYKLSFNFKTMSIEPTQYAKFNVRIYNEDDVLLFEGKDVSSSVWEEYEIYFETFAGAENVYIEIEFGNDENTQVGFAYFDNFSLVSSDTDEYSNVTESNLTHRVDMTDYYLNLPTNNISNNLKDFSSSAYETTGYSEDGVGGIVNSSFFETDYTKFRLSEEEEEQNVFLLSNRTPNANYTINSLFTFDLTSGNYYTITFKLKTNFDYVSTDENNEFKADEHTYGATVGLSGFDYMTGLVSNEEYTEYTMHIHATEDASSTLHIALVSDSASTTGTMVVYDFNFTEIASDEDNASRDYDKAVELMEGSEYDVNTDHVFATETPADEEGDGTTDDSTSDDTGDTTTNNDDFTWLILISTLITALAIVIAVVGYFTRKIKIQKVETKRQETYDRKGSIHHDTIRKEAEDERAKQASELENNIQKFENELASLEKEHKEKVVALRKEENKEVSKSTEKEFKLFAQKRAVITEKIDILKHQLENVNSPEYLLSLERKKYLEHDAKQKQLSKAKKEKKKTDASEETKTSEKKKK